MMDPGVHCLLRGTVKRFGDSPALIGPDATLSFRELDREVELRARRMRASIAPGEWAVLRAVASVAGLVDLLAAIRADVTVFPAHPALPEPVLCDWMVREGIGWRVDSGGKAERRTADPSRGSVVAGAACSDSEDTPAAAILTSGSSGSPKLAVLSHRNLRRSAEGLRALIPLGPGDRYLLSLPHAHVSGLAVLFRCLPAGAAVVLGGAAEDARFLTALGVTHVSMVDTQLARLLASRNPLPELRCVLLGGGPMSRERVASARARGIPVWRSYGLTEMSSTVVVEDPDGAARVLPFRECRIAPDGEILVRGETLFSGYRDNGVTRPARDNAGWFHTRDLGCWEEERLEVIGRLDNQFVSGGENIQPEYIEAVLSGHPSIRAAVVVPRPDPEFGQRAVAFVDVAGALDEPELRGWLAQRLSGFLIPAAFYALPRDGSGLKVRRVELIELARQAFKESI